MKKIISCFLFVMASITCYAQQNTDTIATDVDQMAQFNGGEEGYRKFYYGNIRYPEKMKQKDFKSGYVNLEFIVNVDGTLSDIMITKSLDSAVDKEALRIVGSMPAWIPAKKRGQAVKTRRMLSLQFLSKYIDTDKVYTSVEQMPEFPGGSPAMYKFISEHVIYPEEALKKEVTGRVTIRFVIDTLGNTKDFEILRDIGSGCGNEAARLVANMPKWKPGKQSGIAVNVYYTLPIPFKLPSKNMNQIDSLMADSTNKVFQSQNYGSLEPQFPGGKAALNEYINTHLEYPESAQKDSIEGEILVRFIVDRDGSVLFPETTSNMIGRECGRAAIKLIGSMPKWIPGTHDGQPVRVLYYLPILFKLPQK